MRREIDPSAGEWISSGYLAHSRPGGVLYDPTTIMAGASLVSGLIGSDASSNAADAQVQASQQATQAQKDMFNQTVGLEAPFRQAGIGAMSKLNTLLGIPSGGGSSGPQETEAQIRARLTPQFTTNPNTPPIDPLNPSFYTHGLGGVTSPGGIDQAGLDAAVQAELAKQGQATAAGGNPNDPSYGSLLKPFQQFKPFGMDDFQLDPGYQYQLKYGNQALQNSQAAKNGVLSGGALKDLIGFNQDYAGQGYQSAYDRYMKNFQTGFNADLTGRQFTLGSLMDMTKLGQAAAGNTVNAAPSFSSGMASTITGAGNAAAAGTIGSANAITGGLTGAGNAYLLRNLLNNGGGGAGGGVVPPNPFVGGGVISDAPVGTEAIA